VDSAGGGVNGPIPAEVLPLVAAIVIGLFSIRSWL
jgi:hypothetical protein